MRKAIGRHKTLAATVLVATLLLVASTVWYVLDLKEEQALRKRRVLARQAEMESRLKGSTRYRSNGDGTFTDLTTQLTWAVLDSYQELGGCVTY